MDAQRYSHEAFVDRENEIAFVQEVVKDWASETPRKRAIRFTGPKGSGKSWLLCEIACQIGKNFTNIVVRHLILGEDRPCEETFYLSSSQIRSQPGSWSLFTRDILAYLAKPLELPLPAPIDEASKRLAEQYARSGRRPVLLVDGVDELPLEFALDYLERYVLGPLLGQANALVVLGGRLPKSTETWSSFSLREAEEWVLAPFGPSEAEEQFRRRKVSPPISARGIVDIVQRGGGYPLANLLLAEKIEAGKPWEEALRKALRTVAELYLQAVPPPIRTDFQTLCVLAGFNVEEMMELLKKSALDCRRRLNEFLATRLVRWESGERDIEMMPGERLRVGHEYVIDEAVRRVLEEDLSENERSRWEGLHCAALALYERWAKAYPGNVRWKQRGDYHRGRLSHSSGGEARAQGQRSSGERTTGIKAEEEIRWTRNKPSLMPASG